jgi:hypothetical protein
VIDAFTQCLIDFAVHFAIKYHEKYHIEKYQQPMRQTLPTYCSDCGDTLYTYLPEITSHLAEAAHLPPRLPSNVLTRHCDVIYFG